MSSRNRFEELCASNGWQTKRFMTPQGTLTDYSSSKTQAAYIAWKTCEIGLLKGLSVRCVTKDRIGSTYPSHTLTEEDDGSYTLEVEAWPDW